jgi:hypothetical protein
MNSMDAPVAAPPRLVLPDLEITGFRAFDELCLPRLGRVNVIVGPNSAGKTGMLEALRLLVSGASPATMLDMLVSRDELSTRTLALSEEDVELLDPALSQLFHRPDADSSAPVIRIGTRAHGGPAVAVERGWIVRRSPDEPQRFVAALDNDDLLGAPRRALRIEASGRVRIVPLQGLASILREVPWEAPVPCQYVGANGLPSSEIAELWDRISLTEREDDVLETLRMMAPVERLSLVGDFDGKGDRKPVVKVPGSRKPVPLRTLGDGINRLLGLALAMVNAQGGVVLVDEIENGIHFGVQDDIWRGIFALAGRYDVQVFATTHSWDAVVGFQYAANLSREEGVLYRLERGRQGRIRATAYTEAEVGIAAEQRIEVR